VAISSIVLGFLSWRFVERPFRSGALRLSGRPLFITAGAVMLVFIAVSSVLIFSGGMHGRFTPHAEEVASYLDRTDVEHALTRYPDCFLEPESHFADYKPQVCLRLDPAKKVTYMLVGDSHSAVLWNALAQSMPYANILQANATPCKPFIHPVGSDACKQLMRYIYGTYLPAHPVQGLFLEVRWQDRDMSGIGETIAWARDHHLPVVIIGNVPEYDETLPRLLAYSLAWNKPQLAAQHRVSYSSPLDAKLQKLAADTWHVPYVSLYQAICSNGDCQEYADEAHQVPLLVDDDHFSREGALAIVRKVINQGAFK
jgi:hypothetical protein